MLENKNNTEEDRVAIVEQQLAQAKLIAEEADKKYEEVKSLPEQTKITYSIFLDYSYSSKHYYSNYILTTVYYKCQKSFIFT